MGFSRGKSGRSEKNKSPRFGNARTNWSRTTDQVGNDSGVVEAAWPVAGRPSTILDQNACGNSADEEWPVKPVSPESLRGMRICQIEVVLTMDALEASAEGAIRHPAPPPGKWSSRPFANYARRADADMMSQPPSAAGSETEANDNQGNG